MDSCACPYVCNDNPAIVIDARLQTAKKEHKCCECGKVIASGERYEYTWGVWGGEAMTYKTCAICREIREVLFCDGWVYEQLYEDLYEFLRECFGSLPWAKIRELPQDAQDKVLAIVNEIAEEHIDDRQEAE